MVDAHNNLLKQVVIMASELRKEHKVEVMEDEHLKAMYSLWKEDEDNLKPDFSMDAAGDTAQLLEAVHQSDQSLRSYIDVVIRTLVDFEVQKGWMTSAGE
jgi:hypothetical protein